jgi:hypothetical protein
LSLHKTLNDVKRLVAPVVFTILFVFVTSVQFLFTVYCKRLYRTQISQRQNINSVITSSFLRGVKLTRIVNSHTSNFRYSQLKLWISSMRNFDIHNLRCEYLQFEVWLFTMRVELLISAMQLLLYVMRIVDVHNRRALLISTTRIRISALQTVDTHSLRIFFPLFLRLFLHLYVSERICSRVVLSFPSRYLLTGH